MPTKVRKGPQSVGAKKMLSDSTSNVRLPRQNIKRQMKAKKKLGKGQIKKIVRWVALVLQYVQSSSSTENHSNFPQTFQFYRMNIIDSDFHAKLHFSDIGYDTQCTLTDDNFIVKHK